MILGIDVSTYLEELENGAVYKDNGKVVEPLSMFKDNGVDYMRIRLWVNPYDENNNPYLAGTCDLNNFIKLARLAEKKGYKILLDIHYSDFWADPGKQTLPKAWSNYTFDELVKEIYSYTKEVMTEIKNAGINLTLVQIGNEITNGMCWPLGRIIENGDGTRGNYEALCTLLKQGLKASYEVYPSIKTIIHLERSYDQKIYYEYFDNLRKYNVNFDIIGASYYPYWHGTLDQFFSNMEMCKKEFNKDIMVMELGYAFTLEDYIKNSNGINQMVVNTSNLDSFSFTKEFPLTKEGQAHFVESFLKLAYEHDIKGVFYWEPLWIPGKNICWASEVAQKYIHEEGKSTRNEWANQCLFDYEGNKLPSFDKFKSFDK